jgi:hypothetical protein
VCDCGCGQPVKTGKQYAHGHYLGNGRKPYQSRESIDLGLCKCGCGSPIPRTDKAFIKYRAGKPSQFIRGHVSRMPGAPKPPVQRGPDNNRWAGGIGDQRHYNTRLVLVDVSARGSNDARVCGCGCGWLTCLSANEPDPPFVHGHHLYITASRCYKYDALHSWLRATYRKNGVCDKCGGSFARTEFSLIHGRSYTKSREDYRELCKKCHMNYDRPRLKYVSISDQKSIIERYNLSCLYIRKADSVRQLAINFNVPFGYVRTLVTTTRIT